jgi:hypothetical protein
MVPPDGPMLKPERSFSQSDFPQEGQGGTAERLRTSSSNSWPQPRHWNSYIGMAKSSEK